MIFILFSLIISNSLQTQSPFSFELHIGPLFSSVNPILYDISEMNFDCTHFDVSKQKIFHDFLDRTVLHFNISLNETIKCSQHSPDSNYNSLLFLIQNFYQFIIYIDGKPAISLIEEETDLTIYQYGMLVGVERDHKFYVNSNITILIHKFYSEIKYTPFKLIKSIDSISTFSFSIQFDSTNTTQFITYPDVNKTFTKYANRFLFACSLISYCIFIYYIIYQRKNADYSYIDEEGWRMVKNDVFRSPSKLYILLVLSPSGFQVFLIIFCIIVFNLIFSVDISSPQKIFN